MRKTQQQKRERMAEVFAHMLNGGLVVVKDKADNTIKESRITAIYIDYTVVLPDTIYSDYSIFDITLITK